MTVEQPALVRVQVQPTGAWQTPESAGVEVSLADDVAGGLAVDVVTRGPVSRVRLRWRHPAALASANTASGESVTGRLPESALVLGDAWERSYGDLEWRAPRPERPLPWMALVHDPASARSTGWGVAVRGGAFAFWQIDRDGVSLVLDVRSGSAPVRPGDRRIRAAVVHRIEHEGSAFAAQRMLTQRLCADPLPSRGPLVGANNWYYAYGRGFDAAAVVRDARTIVELADGHPVRPFGVVDDGWSPDGTADGLSGSGGPWNAGRAPTFPDMPGVAAAIAAEGARPGIWFRPLLRRAGAPRVGGSGAPREGLVTLDPSHPAVLDLVEQDVARLVGWGFELIKHDFSTFDVLGRWGFQMGADPLGGAATEPPALADPTITSAEALVGLYARIRRGAGDALVLGCNVVGHLAAGLVDAQRIGDDTSGLDWDRTRRIGVNTLAFRMAQHDAFFTVDADCVPSTPHTDWALNRRWLDLVARSGTALFVSVDPATRTDAVDADLSAALRVALDGGAPGGAEPLDWMSSPTPSRWRLGDAEVAYDWLEPQGADALEPPAPV